MKLTFADWKKKYYPVPAYKVSKRDALAHSLRKWRGLYPSVLKRYGVEINGGYIKQDSRTVMVIGSKECALCCHYAHNYCVACPLSRLEGRCFWSGSPYQTFCSTGNPRPMIAALKKAMRFVKGKKK